MTIALQDFSEVGPCMLLCGIIVYCSTEIILSNLSKATAGKATIKPFMSEARWLNNEFSNSSFQYFSDTSDLGALPLGRIIQSWEC